MKEKNNLKMEDPQIFDKSFYNNFQVLLVDFKENRLKKKPRKIPCTVIFRRYRNEVPVVDVLIGYEVGERQKRFIATSVCRLLSLYHEEEFSITMSVTKNYWNVPMEEIRKKAKNEKKFIPEYFG